MSTPLFEFSQAVSKLKKEKQYSEALKYFKENKSQFSNEEIKGNSYLISAMITALRHSDNIDNAFKFLKQYNIEINESTDEIILSSYGWLLYDKYKLENHVTDSHETEIESHDDEEYVDGSNSRGNKSQTSKLIEEFIQLILKFESDYAYNVLSKIFNIVPKVEKKKTNANWKLVNELCDLIPPEYLKTDCESREVERKGKKFQMEFASDRENWYAYKSKALMWLGKFQECYDISSAALEALTKFHYSNDSWFARRIALSKKQLGNSEDTILELQQILKKKKEWFIEKEIAELYKEKGDLDNAFKFAIQSINNFGDLQYKVDLLFLLGELLNAKQENDLSFKHFSLSRLIRINEEWNIPTKLSSALDSFKRENIPIEKLQELKKELSKYWKTLNLQQQNSINKPQPVNQTMVGKIGKILHNDEKGVDGFIKYNGHKSVYFRVNSNEEIKAKIRIGLELEFKILPEKDGKKEKAIQLRISQK